MFFTLIAFLVALGVLITFHELGHYTVARWCGVKVLRFSVGFGRIIWRRTDKHGTEWALSALPLGGYVKMLDEPEADAPPQEAQQAFNNKSVYQRFAIVAAGPAANLLLAAIIYALLAFVGTQAPAPIIGAPPAQSPAAEAGFQAGDRLLAINGNSVQAWPDVSWALIDRLASGGQIPIVVEEAGGQQLERLLQAPPATIEPDAENPITAVGLALQSPKPLVREVQAGSAAEKAGIKAGDKIIGAANQADLSAADLVALVGQYDNQALTLQIERDGTQLQLTVVPTRSPNAQPDEPARMGVMLAADWPMVTVRHGLIASMQQGVVRTADTVWFSLKMMARMVTGHVSVRNISGPVTIADYAGQTARMGLIAYLGYLALISVSIGVLNLLPIPMLDGGHLMYYLIEIVRGKPLSEHWLAAGQRVGIALLAALMGLAFLNDFNRLFS